MRSRDRVLQSLEKIYRGAFTAAEEAEDTETMARAAASSLLRSKPASVWRSLFISGAVKQMRKQMSKGTLWH